MRIPEIMLKMIVFAGIRNEQGVTFGGTGFLCVSYEHNIPCPFLVTNRHVVDGLSRNDSFVLRANTVDGRSQEVDLPSALHWFYPVDDTVDLAATALYLPNTLYDVQYYNIALRTVDRTVEHSVLCGDPISIVGLFRLHHGRQRNIPIVHTGNVAAIADQSERIPIRDGRSGSLIEVESYLVEAQTLDGLSGSPVWIRETVNLSFAPLEGGGSPLAYGNLKLLGIYQGSWDGEPGVILENDRNLKGRGRRVPVGMGIVVPAEKVVDLIERHPEARSTKQQYVALIKANEGGPNTEN